MKQRIISGVVGGGLTILAVVFHSTVFFNIFVAVVSVIAVYEAMHSTRMVRNNALFAAALIYDVIAMFFPLMGLNVSVLLSIVYVLAIMCIGLKFNRTIAVKEISFVVMLAVVVTLPFMIVAAFGRATDGVLALLITFGGAWFCDIGAYFVGSFFGSHKIAPVISPKKTYEGAVGGILANVILFIILGAIWGGAVLENGESLNWILLIILAVVTSFTGMLGDLSFSFIKRKCGIKDYGNLIPGHGGALDRFDSIIATAPVVCALLQIFPIVIRMV